MKAMVVYDSAYGNTEKIAQAIGRELGAPDQVRTLRVGEVRPEHLAGLTLQARLLLAGWQVYRTVARHTANISNKPGGSSRFYSEEPKSL